MQIPSIFSYTHTRSDRSFSPSEIAAADDAFAALFADDTPTPETDLEKIANHGIEGMMKWRVRELERQITEKVMTAKNLTKETVAALPAEKRVALEKQILREVAEKLKQAIQEEMKQKTAGMAGLDMMDPLPSAKAGGYNFLA